MARVYIAGPMRGRPDLNFPAFDRVAALGRSLGWTVISPADLDRAEGDVTYLPYNGGSPEINRGFAKRDTDAILSLRAEDGDAIALLDGWTESTGAPAEWTLARWVKLLVLDERFRPIEFSLAAKVFRPPGVLPVHGDWILLR
jgi:hypothetical protein